MASKTEIYVRSDQIKCQFCNSLLVIPRNFDELVIHYENVHEFRLTRREMGIEGGTIEVAWLERDDDV